MLLVFIMCGLKSIGERIPLGKGISVRKFRVDGQLSQEVKINLRSAARERIKSSTVPRLC